MTGFIIDTGPAQADIATMVPDWFRDQLPDDATADRIAHDWAYHLIGAMNNPKMMATVRNHLLAQWWFLHALADMHPDLFDELLAAYAERWAAS